MPLQQQEDPREEEYGGSPRIMDHDRIHDDSTTTAVAAARARRKGPTSPSEEPHRSASTRDGRSNQSPGKVQSRSAANVGAGATPARPSREASEIINRVVLTDPLIDVTREKERLAEAIPLSPAGESAISSLGAGGNDGNDVAPRTASRTRQDHSASASRRKDTKFGEYMLGQTLGEGEFGKVKLGWKKDGSVQVAIKLIRRENLNTNPSRLPKIYREIKILSQLSHPNIVRLHEMVETERYIGIIMEYASGGELFDYILNHRYLKDNAARKLFAQLVSGVGYLHKMGIVHRDLKLENLLLDRNRNIIITDFGFANTFNPKDDLGEEIEYNLTNREFVKKMGLEQVNSEGFRRGDLMQTSCGSPCYAAPELVVTDSLYTGRKVDVWSCGVILVSLQVMQLILFANVPCSMLCLRATCHSTMIQRIRRVTTSTSCTNTSCPPLSHFPSMSRRMLGISSDESWFQIHVNGQTYLKLLDTAG
jgi:protein-serine/threonine kinase